MGTSSSCLTLPAPNLLFGPHSVYAVSFWCRIEFFGDLEASPSGGKVLPPRGVCPFVQAPSRMHAARQSCGTRGTGSQIHINRDALCSHTLSGPQAEPLQLLLYTNDEKHVLHHYPLVVFSDFSTQERSNRPRIVLYLEKMAICYGWGAPVFVRTVL